MDEARFERILDRMAASDIAARPGLRGCSAAEIRALEARYGLSLPDTYRRYLAVMGHASGRLFTSDHMAVFYPHVLDMTADCRREIFSPAGFDLPQDALLIAGRLSSQWEFIRCGDLKNSAVWYVREDEWQVRQSHASVLDWLESWCGIAEEAIASGYFKQNPRGTAP